MSTDADADVIWIDESGRDGETSSVADMVAQAASSFMTEQLLQGYEYIDEYKMYYNRETGYYYQPTTPSRMSTDADADVIWIDESGKDGQTSSVADMVAQAASSFMTEQFLQGYEYIDEYKMYYNRETGYYYQPETSLFYHAASKAFYRYDEATASYVLHGRANPDHKWSQRKFRKRTAILFGEVCYSALPTRRDPRDS
ncbi:Protein Y55D9A.2 a [Aphelenchoides avenae]|nr:Protein Y55D9A.2 a [Aphelenchus avenae]